jgi:hypothetical protein
MEMPMFGAGVQRYSASRGESSPVLYPVVVLYAMNLFFLTSSCLQ